MNSELDQLHDSLDLAAVFLLSKGTCLDVEPKIGGTHPKWMVYNGKPYEQMDDFGVPLFLETPTSYNIYHISLPRDDSIRQDPPSTIHGSPVILTTFLECCEFQIFLQDLAVHPKNL